MTQFLLELENDPASDEIFALESIRKSKWSEYIESMEKLAKSGSPVAKIILGDAYGWARRGLAQNTEKAASYFEGAKSAGSMEAAYRLARLYEEEGQFELAQSELELLAEQSYSLASYLLGCSFYYGTLSAPDLGKAKFYFNKATSEGHVLAQRHLAFVNRKHGNFLEKIKGFFQFLASMGPYWKLLVFEPESDRIRNK